MAPSPNPAKSENKSFRDFLAEYEKFANKYVDFMKKYKANPSDMSLISEYGKMVEQYTEWAKKSNNFKDELSGDDLAEYLKVLGRIMQKTCRGSAMRRNLVFKILVIVGGILSVTSLFLPVGFFDGSKYKVENSYLPHLLKSDPLLSWLVVICSAALILLCIGSFFCK